MHNANEVTLRDVAASIGVSVTTVSLALRNHPRISFDRRERVREVARLMGYRPNPMATALSHRRKDSSRRAVTAELAWVNNWRNPKQLHEFQEFKLLWQGALHAAESHGFRLQEFIVNKTLRYPRLDRILQARNIQGILIPPHGEAAVTCPNLTSMDWSRYSIVRFGYTVPDIPAHVVAGNQIQANLLAVSKMAELGYKRIGYICDRRASTRNKAALLLCQRANTERAPATFAFDFDHADSEGSVRQLENWMKENRPDAILTELAETRLHLERLGYRVPQDMGLAATSVLDGNADAGVVQNSVEIGKAAVETLIGCIYRNETGFPKLHREMLIESSWQDGSTLPRRD